MENGVENATTLGETSKRLGVGMMKQKFSFIAFNEITSNLENEIIIDDEISINNNPPFTVDKHWQRWLGSIRCDEIHQANLVFICKTSTDTPQILDHEHQRVQRKIYDFLYSFILYGIPGYSAANMITGSIEGDRISIREVSSLEYFYVIYNGAPYTLTEADIPQIVQIYKSLSMVFDEQSIFSNKYFRLRHGLTAYFKGIQEKENYYRIPQLVRAIEALIMPKVGKTTTQFAHKCKTFVKPSPESEKYLLEIYELRSKVEHLHSLLDVYPNISNDEALDIIDLRVRMLEEIARIALMRILFSPNVLKHFVDNDSINNFWSLSDQERQLIWGAKLDLRSIK